MNAERNSNRTRRRIAVAAVIAGLLTTAACGHLAMMGSTERPEAAAFGTGPRVSTTHRYTATLEPREPLRLRQLLSVPVRITDVSGRPVTNATVTVDGGMPEHGHGLPTQPRVTRSSAEGVYEIEGLRFSMGGWWEVKLCIDSPAGQDNVTFNLSL